MERAGRAGAASGTLTFWKWRMCHRASSCTGGLYLLSWLLRVSYSFPRVTCGPEKGEGSRSAGRLREPESRRHVGAEGELPGLRARGSLFSAIGPSPSRIPRHPLCGPCPGHSSVAPGAGPREATSVLFWFLVRP